MAKPKSFIGILLLPYIICFFAEHGVWPSYPASMEAAVAEMTQLILTQKDDKIRNYCQGKFTPSNNETIKMAIIRKILNRFQFGATTTTSPRPPPPPTVPPTSAPIVTMEPVTEQQMMEPPTEPPPPPVTDPPTEPPPPPVTDPPTEPPPPPTEPPTEPPPPPTEPPTEPPPPPTEPPTEPPPPPTEPPPPPTEPPPPPTEPPPTEPPPVDTIPPSQLTDSTATPSAIDDKLDMEDAEQEMQNILLVQPFSYNAHNVAVFVGKGTVSV